MVYFFLILTMALTTLSGAASAELLNSSQIRSTVGGSKFVGINEFKNPYVYRFHSGGRMKGLIGKKNQFNDIGRWWVREDKLCMHWELWAWGKPVCFGIDLVGDHITRLKEDGTVQQKSTLVR